MMVGCACARSFASEFLRGIALDALAVARRIRERLGAWERLG